MRNFALVVAGAALAGCAPATVDSSMPSESEILRLEAALSKHPCVGDLKTWERNYRFSRKVGLLSTHSLHPDLDVIEFHLRKAGTITIRPEPKVMQWSANGDWPDSGTVESLDGRFKINGGVLRIDGCTARGRR